jgi:hypothetical protein
MYVVYIVDKIHMFLVVSKNSNLLINVSGVCNSLLIVFCFEYFLEIYTCIPFMLYLIFQILSNDPISFLNVYEYKMQKV